jgi:hypothetical protein
MKICLVTTFPPSQGGLSEYGLHIAEELRRNPFLSLTVLADRMSPSQPELDGFSVLRCWSFDDPASAYRLLETLNRLKPDVVWFNLLFSTFGRNPVNAFLGLLTPLLARLSGRYTHVTLHHLMDTVDLKDAGVQHPRTYRLAGAVATRMLLLSNSVSVPDAGLSQDSPREIWPGECSCAIARSSNPKTPNILTFPAAAIRSTAFSRSASGEPISGSNS